MDGLFGLDSGYFSLALSLAALWGMWHGFVRGKYIETIAGLGACVGLMLIALLIVHDPAGTVGKVGNWGDAAGREVASGVAGAVQPGNRAQAAGGRTRPRRPGDLRHDRASALVRARVRGRQLLPEQAADGREVLRRAPASSGTTPPRRPRSPTSGCGFPRTARSATSSTRAWKDDEDTATQPRVEMMQGQSTGKRLALLVIIIAGLLGALLLLGWLAFWLIAFAALALFFLLIAPFVFLLPAFGEAGRQGFITWGKRLLGALIAKLLYAIVLGVVIYVAALIAEMGNPGGLGWLGVWVVEAIFWWVAFLKRHELVNLLTLNAAHGGEGGRDAPRRARRPLLQDPARAGGDAHRPPSGRAPRPAAGRAREHDRGSARRGPWLESGSPTTPSAALDLEYQQSQRKLRERRGSAERAEGR